MSLVLNDLYDLLKQYKERLQHAHISVQQLTGAIGAIENQIYMVVAKAGQNQQGEDDATKEGQQPESNSTKYKDRDCRGKKSKASSSNCLQ